VYARVWDVTTGRPRTPPLISPKLIHSLAFSPDSQTLAVGTVGPILLWDVQTAKSQSLPQVGPIALMRFSPDGRWLAACTRAGWRTKPGLQVWDMKVGKAVAPLAPLPNAPTDMVFLPDGRTLQTVEVGKNNTLRRWDASTGQQVGPAVPFAPPPSVIRTVLRSDGGQFLTGSASGSVQQWGCLSGQKVGPAMVHPSPVAQLAYGPDGGTVAVGHVDGTARLWDAATSRPVGPRLPHTGKLIGLTFDPGGTLLTTTEDGTTCAWPVAAPLPDDTALLSTWHLATFGIRVDGAETVVLDMATWDEQRQQLRARWPSAVRPDPAVPDRVAWHEARARDAVQAGNLPVASWHLEQLSGLQPRAWIPCARLGGLHTTRGDLNAAAAEYDRAGARGGGADLLDWYRHRALTCNRFAQHEAEKWYLDRLLATVKDDWRLFADRAEANGRRGLANEREADLSRAIELGADRTYVLQLADDRAGKQQWRPALELCLRAEEMGPLDLDISRRLALLYLKLGDRKGYRRVCNDALKALQVRPLPAQLLSEVGWLCAMGPEALDDLDPLVSSLEQALQQLPPDNKGMRTTFARTVGAVLYRAGRFEDAVKHLGESLAAPGTTDRSGWAILAMAHHRLAQAEEVRKAITKARKRGPAATLPAWLDLEESLLCREAEARLREF
jgi:hypothetical protein